MKKDENNIVLPKNIKQMGNIDDKIKIYMEDYVFTYLQQYAKLDKGQEKLAVLIGSNYIIDGNDVLFINGAIKGINTIFEEGMVKLSENSFDYINEQMERHFKGEKIVGWFYSQPGFSDYINEEYINYHKLKFEHKDVFFLTDPLENVAGFYRFSNDNFEIVRGFFIYYEKNEAMSNYMTENKMLENKDEEEEKFKIKDEKIVNVTRKKDKKAKKIITLNEYKKMSSIFSSLSAILFLVCFIMGAGLIQSDDKITKLEKRLTKLDESYRYILSQIKNDNVQSVFAQNTTQTTEITETTQATTQITETTTEQITISHTESITKDVTNLKKYEVKEGDSLEMISKKIYGNRSKIEEIMAINELDNPDKIYSGMILFLP